MTLRKVGSVCKGIGKGCRAMFKFEIDRKELESAFRRIGGLDSTTPHGWFVFRHGRVELVVKDRETNGWEEMRGSIDMTYRVRLCAAPVAEFHSSNGFQFKDLRKLVQGIGSDRVRVLFDPSANWVAIDDLTRSHNASARHLPHTAVSLAESFVRDGHPPYFPDVDRAELVKLSDAVRKFLRTEGPIPLRGMYVSDGVGRVTDTYKVVALPASLPDGFYPARMLRAARRMGGKTVWMRVYGNGDVEWAGEALTMFSRVGLPAHQSNLYRRIEEMCERFDGKKGWVTFQMSREAALDLAGRMERFGYDEPVRLEPTSAEVMTVILPDFTPGTSFSRYDGAPMTLPVGVSGENLAAALNVAGGRGTGPVSLHVPKSGFGKQPIVVRSGDVYAAVMPVRLKRERGDL